MRTLSIVAVAMVAGGLYLSGCAGALVHHLSTEDFQKAEARQQSVKQITDQPVLARIAVEDDAWFVRRDAVKKLTDQALLARIAIKDHVPDVRAAAVGRLTDQALLTQFATKDKNPYVRASAVYNLTDQALLTKFLTTDADVGVRAAAVHNLTDQTLLRNLATGDAEGWVRSAAVGHVTDQALLARMAIEDKVPEVREAATENLTDQALLARIATEDPVLKVQEAAIANLTDQPLLAQLCAHGLSSYLLPRAVEKVTDQALLLQIALVDRDCKATDSAIGKLTDQAMLGKVAIEGEAECARELAVEKVTDQVLLARVAERGDESPVTRFKAIAAVDDSNPVLMRLAGDLASVTNDARQSLARVKLAIQDPLIKNRIARTVLEASIRDIQEGYTDAGADARRNPMLNALPGYPPPDVVTFDGEALTFKLVRADSVAVVESNWCTVFEQKMWSHGGAFIPARVEAGEFMAKLFHLPSFTHDDLLRAVGSTIPEVRLGAVADINDSTILAKLALEDKAPEVRAAAGKKLSGQR